MGEADVTGMLRQWAAGDHDARDRLIPYVYEELRRRAAAHLRRERRDLSLQPTDLVHEAYLRLIDQNRAAWQNRAQFLAVAAEVMRRVLVDRARAHLAAKRSGQWARITLESAVMPATDSNIDVLDLDAALKSLQEIDARKSRIAELRFFGGLSLRESAAALEISMATAERDWQFSRAWLYAALSDTPDDP